MKTKNIVALGLLVALCGCAEKPQPPVRWEYKELKVHDLKLTLESIAWRERESKKIDQAEYDKKIDNARHSAGYYIHPTSDLIDLGYDGWELVTTFYEPAAQGKLVMLFKRPYVPKTE
jgi:hypothetical protein